MLCTQHVCVASSNAHAEIPGWIRNYSNHQVCSKTAHSKFDFKCAESDSSLWSFVLFIHSMICTSVIHFSLEKLGRLGKNWSCLTLHTKREVSLHTNPNMPRFCFWPHTGTGGRLRGERGCFCFVGSICSSWSHCFLIAFAKDKKCTGARACLVQTLQTLQWQY